MQDPGGVSRDSQSRPCQVYTEPSLRTLCMRAVTVASSAKWNDFTTNRCSVGCIRGHDAEVDEVDPDLGEGRVTCLSVGGPTTLGTRVHARTVVGTMARSPQSFVVDLGVILSLP